MTDYRSLYDRDYIGYFDLPGGKDLTLTIRKVVGGELTAIGGRKSKKPIIHFKQNVKPMICNKTNAKTIATMYGNTVEAWAAKNITLFVSMTRDPSGGGEVECIRIRPGTPTRPADEDVVILPGEGSESASARVSSPATSAPPPTAGPDADATRYITDAQESALLDHLEAAGVSIKAFCAKAEIATVRELLASRFQGSVKWIQAQKK